ncbi:uncharacterized protein [Hoplias malabaricus]|uniref:uncharacterized protein n=1 Tax=Hoplias malabaricus TaxID=27720 RepID=UPI0034618207
MFPRCQTVMERVVFLSLLVCDIIHRVNSETLHVNMTEGYIAVLYCGTLTKGTVTWSRDIDGQRVDILTTHNGETTKHISDPDRRYSTGANLLLSIFRVSQSDTGRYYCNGTTVELTVTPRYNAEHPTPTQTTGGKVREGPTTEDPSATGIQGLWIGLVLLGIVVSVLPLASLFYRTCGSQKEEDWGTADDVYTTVEYVFSNKV